MQLPRRHARSDRRQQIAQSSGENMTTPTPRFQNSVARPHQELIDGAYLRAAWYVAAWSDIADGELSAPPARA
jgi:hypothetical protein